MRKDDIGCNSMWTNHNMAINKMFSNRTANSVVSTSNNLLFVRQKDKPTKHSD